MKLALHLLIATCLLLGSASAQDWQRYPVFPPGYARVCATETQANGEVVALDICGRIIDAKTARVISYPNRGSSVDNALRTESGWLIRYLDGSLYVGQTLAGDLSKRHDSVLQIVPDRNAGAYVAASNGDIYALTNGMLTKIGLCSKVKTIAGVDQKRLFALDSAGQLFDMRFQQVGSEWKLQKLQSCNSYRDISKFVCVMMDDSLLVRKTNDAYSIYTMSNDSLHAEFNMRSIPGFEPITTLKHVGAVGAIASNTGVVLFEMGTRFDECQIYPVACAALRFSSRTWTLYARDQLVDGRLTSAEIIADTLVYGTTNGSITRVDPAGYRTLVRRPMRGDLVRWLGSVRNGSTVVFYTETVTCDSNNPAGILFAVWDAKNREWGRVFDVVASPTWPYSDGNGLPGCDVSKANNRIVFSRLNAIMIVDLSTGTILRETRLPEAVVSLRYLQNHSILVSGSTQRFVVDTLLVVRDQTVYTDCSMRYVVGSSIDLDGNCLLNVGASNYAVYHAASGNLSRIMNDLGYSSVECAFLGNRPEFLVVGERDGRIEVRMLSRNDVNLVGSFSAGNPSPNVTAQSGKLSDGPDYVRPFWAAPSFVIVRGKERDVRYVPPPRGWFPPTPTRDRWTNSGLQHQLDDSTYMTIFSQSEMWVYTLRTQGTSVAGESQSRQLSVYPNPAHDVVTVSIDATITAGGMPSMLRLINSHGSIIAQQELLTDGSTSFHTHSFSLASLPSGVYFVEVIGSSTTTIPISVVR